MKGMAFSAEMAQAIYEGRKTMFREVMEPQPDAGKMRWNGAYWEMHMGYPLGHDVPLGKYSIGERLFVQEPHTLTQFGKAVYKDATDQSGHRWTSFQPFDAEGEVHWLPPRAMTRGYARSIIEITGIKVERLQDITHKDAYAEGMRARKRSGGQDVNFIEGDYRNLFKSVWQNIYPDHPIKGWDANPWVFTYGVKRVEDGKWVTTANTKRRL